MTVNVKPLYKPTESFGYVNPEDHTKKRSKSIVVFILWYVPIAITMLACLLLSTLSLRLSYLNSVSVQELREEVNKLKTLVNNNWVSDLNELDHGYDDYVDIGNFDTSSAQQESKEMVSNVIGTANRTDVIGVIKYIATDDIVTRDPESELATILLKESRKRRVVRSAHYEPELEHGSSEEHRSFSSLPLNSKNTIIKTSDITVVDADKQITKRSLVAKDTSSKKLMKSTVDLHDSVEEFAVGADNQSPKSDIHPKRHKGRPRHNIETLDERAGSGKKKILPAVHLDGDSSAYVDGKHTNYNGNGHLSHPSPTYSDWVEADWVKSMGMNEFFDLEKGILKIKESGLYLLYAQIYYLDDHDTNGFRVLKNENTLLQCTTMTHSIERLYKGNTCFTSRVEFLKENDLISVRDLANSRYTIFEGGKSFFGLVKLK